VDKNWGSVSADFGDIYESQGGKLEVCWGIGCRSVPARSHLSRTKRGNVLWLNRCFKLEEHEIVDGMEHHLILEGPRKPGDNSETIHVICDSSKVDSNWELKFNLSDDLPLLFSGWTFYVNGYSDMKGGYIVATGFSIAGNLVCHQALSKRTSK
jgi:hypothetical protein